MYKYQWAVGQVQQQLWKQVQLYLIGLNSLGVDQNMNFHINQKTTKEMELVIQIIHALMNSTGKMNLGLSSIFTAAEENKYVLEMFCLVTSSLIYHYQ